MRNKFQSGLLVLSGVMLAACGGGGSSSVPPVVVTPPPSNSAPVFSSASSVSVEENALNEFYTVTATDADNDTLDFEMSGGADIDKFEFSSTDGLSFENPPNFESPVDQNGDNVYEVEFTVTDGNGGSAVLMLSVTVTDVETETVRNKDVVFDNALVTQNVLYRTVGTGAEAVNLYMDIFTPEGDTATDRPVMIFAFGGGFVAGDRSQVAVLAANYALRGYVAASIDYRLFTNGTPTEIQLLDTSVKATHCFYPAATSN